jgi:hypothetical protein
MRVSDAAAMIADTAEAEGLLLIHDQRLPSATALIAGGPISGSWWSHPLAGVIYSALASLDERFATCKLVAGKLTLVAPRLWAGLAAVGVAKLPWQVGRLLESDLDLLDLVEASPDPVLLDQPELRACGRRLEARLLVAVVEVHTDAGHHLRGLEAWSSWLQQRDVEQPLPEPAVAMDDFERVLGRWGAAPAVLPWPSRTRHAEPDG